MLNFITKNILGRTRGWCVALLRNEWVWDSKTKLEFKTDFGLTTTLVVKDNTHIYIYTSQVLKKIYIYLTEIINLKKENWNKFLNVKTSRNFLFKFHQIRTENEKGEPGPNIKAAWPAVVSLIFCPNSMKSKENFYEILIQFPDSATWTALSCFSFKHYHNLIRLTI